ncbi:MAG: lipoprotein localization factor LolB [Neisseriaceae bacterium]|nr:MAG: lipoprotein localization factor LolB [Neisseriaceae bacterium]
MNQIKYPFLLLLLIISLISSCTSIPNKNIVWQSYHDQKIDFKAFGRLSIKIDHRGSHGNFDWNNQHSRSFSIIDINTPIGNTIGQLCKDFIGVIAENNKGEIFTGNNASELSEKLLGFQVPIDYLDLWINGYASTQSPYNTSGNKLYQNNWTIERILDKNQKPKTILLQGNGLSITLFFDQFSKSDNLQHKNQDLICPNRNL